MKNIINTNILSKNPLKQAISNAIMLKIYRCDFHSFARRSLWRSVNINESGSGNRLPKQIIASKNNGIQH